MTQFTPLIICNETDESKVIHPLLDFENQEIDCFGFGDKGALASIIFKLTKDPKALQIHLQRIHFCYHNNLTEDLFAALVDFLIILEGKGTSLSHRMVEGAKSKLHVQQYSELKEALSFSGEKIRQLQGNIYSIFTQGLIGVSILVKKEKIMDKKIHDPLDLARDYIAYSQLDAAIETLEGAIILDFERQELHTDLLELYKLTRSKDKFFKMYDTLVERVETIPATWDKLKGFFNDR